MEKYQGKYFHWQREHKHTSREPASCFKKIIKIQTVGTTTKLSEEKQYQKKVCFTLLQTQKKAQMD